MQPQLEDGPYVRKPRPSVTGGSFEIGKIPGLIGNGRFSIAFWMKPEQVEKGPVLSNEMPGTGRNGILVEFVNGRLRWNINTRWISGVSTVETRAAVSAGRVGSHHADERRHAAGRRHADVCQWRAAGSRRHPQHEQQPSRDATAAAR